MTNPFKATDAVFQSIASNGITTVARDAIANPADGTIIYNTDDTQWQYFHSVSGEWYEVGSGPADPAIFISLKDGSGAYVAPSAVGGLENTTTQGQDLDGLPVAVVLNRMLYPTIDPTFTAPSLSLTLSGASLVEYGSTVAPNMSATFSRGSINTSYTHLDSAGAAAPTNRAGLPNEARFIVKGLTEDTQTTTSLTPSFQTQSGPITGDFVYSVEIDHDLGDQPYDSTGSIFGSPLSAGTLTDSQVISISYYNFNNGAADASLVLTSTGAQRQTLQSQSAQYTVDFTWSESAATNRHTFAIANNYGTVSKIQQFSTVSNSFQDIVTLDTFNITQTTRTAPNGDAVNYSLYTAYGPKAGTRLFKVIF